MTAPEVDKAQRLVDSLEDFIHMHRGEIYQISVVLDRDIDEVIMDMLMSGYCEVRNQAQQVSGATTEEWTESIKGTDELIDKLCEETVE